MQYDKVDPELLVVFDDYISGRLNETSQLQTDVFLPQSHEDDQTPRISAFIKCTEEIDIQRLRHYDISVSPAARKLLTVHLPISRLVQLSNDPTIEQIIASRRLSPCIGEALQKTNYPIFSQKLPHLTGQGVIVGIVDTGIDSTHLAFQKRILSIWDQTLSGPGVSRWDYGIELKGDRLVYSQDRRGHGTHVAGIAAGDHNGFGGIATKAELIVVKTTFHQTDIADAIEYIFEIADDVDKPAVVNLSLGGHTDAHDGSDPLSTIIDSVTGPRRIVCCAASNEGERNIHARTVITQDSTTRILFEVPNDSHIAQIELNGWYSGKDEIAVKIRSPLNQETDYQSFIDGGRTSGRRVYENTEASISISTPWIESNGDHRFYIHMVAKNGFFTPGVWSLLLQGRLIKDGLVDVWLPSTNSNSSAFFTSHIDNEVKIGSPGAARSAITVGSYTSRNQWQARSGVPQAKPNLTLDDISPFSSAGPLRKGGLKPDLIAPGAAVISCKSSFAHIHPDLDINDTYCIDSGTSMATPFVTGITALLLQHQPKLSPSGIKEYLRNNCRHLTPNSLGFNSRCGYGLIDLDLLSAQL